MTLTTVPAHETRSGRRVAAVLVMLAATVFLVRDWHMLAAPFGVNHDGWNASVWATGSRSLREEGPIASRLGTHSPELPVYANHPPLIYVETAVTEAVGGPSRAATRAPAWLASVVALMLLARLLLDRGLHPVAAGAAVLVTAATPMFLVYGTMLDTPVTSLPFGIGLILLWLRVLDDRPDRRVHPALAATIAALAVLAGWQSLLMAAVVSVWALVRLARGRGRRVELAFAGGAAAGFALLVGWLVWAYEGSLRPLFAQYRVRTGQTAEARATLGQVLATEWRDATELFTLGLLLLAVLGLVVALRDTRTRGVAAAVLAVTLPYGLVFRTGAVAHDYWNYWFLIPLAVGLAAGADRLLAARPLRRAVVAAAVALTATMVLGDVVKPLPARRAIEAGLGPGRVLADMPVLDPSQDRAWYAGFIGDPAPWLALAARRPTVDVSSAAALRELAEQRPADLVLVGRLECDRDRVRPVHTFEPAAEVARRPPVTRCA